MHLISTLYVSNIVQIKDTITSSGGEYQPLRESDEQIEHLEELTHIISTHIEFPQYTTALEHGIHIVKPSWVIASSQKGKLATPRQHSPDPAQYFHDVVLSVGDLPQGDKDAIVAGVMALGGQYSQPLSRLVTHLVTNDTDNDKCAMVERKKMAVKIVVPHWFDDCLKLGRLIGEKPYMFPEPEILKSNHPTKVRDFGAPHIEGATVASPSMEPESLSLGSPSEVRKNRNAWSSPLTSSPPLTAMNR